jgi:chromosome segregation ATPase
MASVRIPAGMTLSPERLREFVDAYEEKISITSEIRTLEAKAAHGRIPRRRYKVQRRSLEEKLEALTGTIAQLREVIRKAGGSYSDSVSQIEAAEIEVEETDLSLKNIEVRHETGEISIEAYRKQLADLEKSKEKAEKALNGLLMRLRSEIR